LHCIDHFLFQHQVAPVGGGDNGGVLAVKAARLAQPEEAFYFLVNAADCLHFAVLVDRAGHLTTNICLIGTRGQRGN
jgi:hypothetical protein